jgi:hypothetical protein
MHSEFRFTRHGLSSKYDVTVRLVAEHSNAFSVLINPNLALNAASLNAVLLGVHAAYAAAELQAPLTVTVTEVVDHCGETGELGFKTCGEAAMFYTLGLPHKAPFPGYVLGEA